MTIKYCSYNINIFWQYVHIKKKTRFNGKANECHIGSERQINTVLIGEIYNYFIIQFLQCFARGNLHKGEFVHKWYQC